MNDLPRIAVIDDDDAVCDATASLLRAHGYRAETFASGDQFLNSPRFQNFRCIISDIRMPGMTGLDLQNHLRGSGHNIPIIFTTALSSDDVRTAALNGGANGVLHKPYSEKSLIDCVVRTLGTYCRRR
jgi:FixJ family two-component response regulator